jgi:hypothetical protein
MAMTARRRMSGEGANGASRMRARKLAALARLRKRAAYAPRGQKRPALARLKAIVTDMLRKELCDV